MQNAKYLILIIVASSTFFLQSCSKNDSSSSDSDNSTDEIEDTQTFVDSSFCVLTKNSSNNSSSLILNGKELNSRSSARTNRVLYVDQSVLSNYQTDDYLFFDIFDENHNVVDGYWNKHEDTIDLGEPGVWLVNQFTQEAKVYVEYTWFDTELYGSENKTAPAILFVDNDTIKYGFGDDWRDCVTVDNISIQNKGII